MDASHPGDTQGQQEQAAPALPAATPAAPQPPAFPELVVPDGEPTGESYQGQPYQAAPSALAQPAWTPSPGPSTRVSSRRWLLIGGLALAFVLTLALGAFIGATLHSTANVAGGGPSAGNLPGRGAGQGGAQGPGQGPGQGRNGQQSGSVGTPGAQGQGPGQGQPGGRGQIPPLTVTSVSGDSIQATAPDGSSVTVQTSASTTYTQGGQATTASAVTVGSHILVQGTRNSDGSIEATSIDVQ